MVEFFLSSTDVLVYLIIQILLYFPCGFLLLERCLKSIPLVIKLPIFISAGMLIVDIILSTVGIFYIGNPTLLLVTGISYSLLLVKLLVTRRSSLQILINNFRSIRWSSVISVLDNFRSIRWSSVISVLVVILVMGHFCLAAGYMGWPPAGDVIVHGFLTSLLIDKQALQTSLAPIAPTETWFEPFGLHVLAANFSLTFGIYPAVALFVMGTLIIILILLLIYSAVYILTGSIVFSIMALMSSFYVSNINVEYWLIGYYYNGSYASLFGFLAVVTYVFIRFVVPSALTKKDKGISVASFVSLGGISLIYPPLSVLPILHLMAAYVYRKIGSIKKILYSLEYRLARKISKGGNTGIRITPIFAILSLTIFVIVIFNLFSLFIGSSYLNSSSTLSTINVMVERLQRISFPFSLSNTDFMLDITGPLTVLTMGAAVLSIIKGKLVYLSSFYLLVSITVTLATWDLTSKYMWFILPRRTFIFLNIINWILIFTYAHLLIIWLISVMNFSLSWKGRILKASFLKFSIYALIAIPVILLFLPYIISHAILEQANRGAWFPRSESFRNDYQILMWISKNIGSTDLIMVDNSLTSLFINSLSLKNLTTFPSGPGTAYGLERSFENLAAWERPELIRQFIDKYDVRYVVLLTWPTERDPIYLGGEGRDHVRKYTNSEYQNIFSRMSFLEPVKTYGTATVYKVNALNSERPWYN